MNKKERIRNTLKGMPTDRVPTAWYKHFPDQRDNTVADQVRWARETDADMLCIETDGYMQFDCGNLDLRRPEVLRDLRPHRPEDFYIEGQVDRARRIAEGLRDGAAVTYMLFTPYSTIKHTIGSETLIMNHRKANPEEHRHAGQGNAHKNFSHIERMSR